MRAPSSSSACRDEGGRRSCNTATHRRRTRRCKRGKWNRSTFSSSAADLRGKAEKEVIAKKKLLLLPQKSTKEEGVRTYNGY